MSLIATTPGQAVDWIVPDFAVLWSDASSDWALNPYRRGFAPGDVRELKPRTTYGFLFTAPARDLDRLVLDLAAGVPAGCGLWAELWSNEGDLLRRGYVSDADAPGAGSFTLLDLRGLTFEIGAKLTVRLRVVANLPGGTVRVLASDQPVTGMAFQRRLVRLRNDRKFVYRTSESVARSNVLLLPRGLGLAAARPAMALLAAAFPDDEFTGVYCESASDLWRWLEGAEVVALAKAHQLAADLGRDYDRLCAELFRRGVCTFALDVDTLENSPVVDGPVERATRSAIEDQQRCRFILRAGPCPTLFLAEAPLEPMPDAPILGLPGSLQSLQAHTRAAMYPKVAIVSVLYRKAEIITRFLEHIRRQNYPGEIVTVLVDDCSPEPDGELAEAFRERLEAFGDGARRVRLVWNAENSGNCQSRMTGLAAEEADIYVVIDCDCLINRDFVASHVFEHALPGADVVIGPLNIEASDRDPAELVRELEAAPDRLTQECDPQDPVQADGFLNCITRNFSIKRQALPPEGLFDLDFSYSAQPGSGFGWEDVEMGYRLYAGGAGIRFTPHAFSVHATHPSSASESVKVRGSMRNFERLFEKHEDLELAGRRWAVMTFDRIERWADAVGADTDPMRRQLEARFSAASEWQRPLLSLMRGETRRLRVLSYRWHVPHQYELYKLPHDFTLATGVGENGMIERWAYDQRPFRRNVRFRHVSEIDPSDYDVAILHFDENVLAPELCNNTIPASWGDPFHWLLGMPLPKAAICHGTPQFIGQYGADPGRKTAFLEHEDEKLRMVDLLADAGVHVVCNSHQAHAEWGFRRSRVIWHGFDPQEFPRGRGDLDILALNADSHRPHYRGAWEQLEVEARLAPGIRVESARHFGGALEPRDTNAYASARFRGYVDRIGRFKAYLNTTLRSPMPRSRGEAMMTGVVPVCLNNHDVALFIENGTNGFHSDEPAELADFLNHLCRHEETALRMGAAARRTAMDLFNHDRYLTAWVELLEQIAR
jgi:GT2 family glycosyltransferase